MKLLRQTEGSKCAGGVHSVPTFSRFHVKNVRESLDFIEIDVLNTEVETEISKALKMLILNLVKWKFMSPILHPCR